jgi:hypothetical protein
VVYRFLIPRVEARDAVSRWLATHTAALVWVLVALWAPPIVITVLIDVHLVRGASTGYPGLLDPGLLISIAQVVVMALALSSWRTSRLRAWHLLRAALGLWLLYTAWTLQWRLRLLGSSDLISKETLLTVTALAMATAVIVAIREPIRRYDALAQISATRRPTARQDVKPGESIPAA